MILNIFLIQCNLNTYPSRDLFEARCFHKPISDLGIESIDKLIHIQVFVTPKCPYCPSAVRTAHRLALANKNITADMVEATEFPYLSQKYSVRGVQKSVINENWSLEGAVPEQMFVEKINESLK
ncbi:MAG: thioredoxin family protein [Candidatus Marinimicrobia bacterium]|nr:thioredoxin family protein [Candidatus Neomarinimicrobiota bacterium]